MKKNDITITEIASLSGVNISTVSRAINHPEMVAEKTRQKVMYYVRKYDYKPNIFAQGLQTKKSRIVALVVPNFSNLSFANISKGVQERLNLSDYSIVIFNSHEDELLERKICKEIAKLHIDGVIFASGSSLIPPINLLPEDTAKLFIDRDGSDINVDSLIFDFAGGLDKAVKHLKVRNHRKIALIAGDISSYTGQEKVLTFKKALQKHELPLHPNCIVDTLWSAKEGWNATEKLLSMEEAPTAIIAATDTLALGAIGAAASREYKIPEEISIVGFNNEPGSECFNPPLTTMKFSDYGIGNDAATLILKRIYQPDSELITTKYPLEIIERNTVGNARNY